MRILWKPQLNDGPASLAAVLITLVQSFSMNTLGTLSIHTTATYRYHIININIIIQMKYRSVITIIVVSDENKETSKRIATQLRILLYTLASPSIATPQPARAVVIMS